jgi:hypothetical protein
MNVAAVIKPLSSALHGGSFETSPNPKNGEVSKAPPTPLTHITCQSRELARLLLLVT